jgi:hypothetical protein
MRTKIQIIINFPIEIMEAKVTNLCSPKRKELPQILIQEHHPSGIWKR